MSDLPFYTQKCVRLQAMELKDRLIDIVIVILSKYVTSVLNIMSHRITTPATGKMMEWILKHLLWLPLREGGGGFSWLNYTV